MELEDWVCHVSLYSADTAENRDTVFRSSSTRREIFESMTGQRTVTGKILCDPVDSKSKLFFLFPDLSIRIPDDFSLKCIVIDPKQY